jgi:hypothetical protein
LLVPPMSSQWSMLDWFCYVAVGAEKFGTDVVAIVVVVFAFIEFAISIEKPTCSFSFRIQVMPFDEFCEILARIRWLMLVAIPSGAGWC